MISGHARLDRLFLHYFDIHFIEDRGAAAGTKQFFNEMRLATRLAVASANTVFLPAASYFESPLCRRIVSELDELLALGMIVLSGSSRNLDDFVQERLTTGFYREGSVQHAAYRSAGNTDSAPPYMPRTRGATKDIVDHWGRKVSNDELARMLRDAAGAPIGLIESRLERVPQELGGLAFIPEHVYDILDLGTSEVIVQARIRSVINEGYFASYVRDLDAGVVVDLRYLASDFLLPSAGRNLSYSKMVRFLHGQERIRQVSDCSQSELVRLGDDPAWQVALQAMAAYVGQPLATTAALDLGKRDPERKATGVSSASIILQEVPPVPESNQTFQAMYPTQSVLCVAAAAVEFSVVRKYLETQLGAGTEVYLDANRKYYAIEFKDAAHSTVWHLASLSFQGEVDAVQGVDRFCHALKPTLVLMVGMCMSMPKRELPVGSVMVPNEVFSFDHQRLTASGVQHRPHGERVDNGLYSLARILSSDPNLRYRVVADKGLASATIKIEDPDAALVKQIESSFPDIAAFDMEGWGFYRAGDGRQCLWIKGVADSGESQSSAASGQTQKHSTQANATENAADFALLLVRKYVGATLAKST